MSTEKQRTCHWKWSAAVPLSLPVMPDIWIQELEADSIIQECDQDSTNKGGLLGATSTLGVLIKVYRTDLSKRNWKLENSQLCLHTVYNWTEHPTSPSEPQAKQRWLDDTWYAPACTAILNQLWIWGLVIKRDVTAKQENTISPSGLKKSRLGIVYMDFNDSWIKAGFSLLSWNKGTREKWHASFMR